MKKITLLLFTLFVFTYANAQITCTQTFTTSGTDDGPTVLTINLTDVTCHGTETPTSMRLVNPAGSLASFFCSNDMSSWFGFDLSVDGGSAVTGCDDEFDGYDITGFTSLTITSHDDDVYSDSVTITIDVEVTYTPSSPPNCDAVLDEITNIGLNGDISWSDATGGATGYYLTAGTTSGGTDILNNVDVGDVTSYSLGALVEGTMYYVTITPYNGVGNATGCSEQTFTTLVVPANDLFANAIVLSLNDDVTGSTIGATQDEATAPDVATVEDNTSADNDSPWVWYSYTGSGTPERITLSTCGVASTDFDTEIFVFTGSSGSLTCIDDGYDECGGSAENYAAETSFDSDGTTTYYIAVGGYDSDDIGNFHLVITGASLSIEDNTIEGFSMYPNPIKDMLHFNAQENIDAISVYNMLGQEVRRVSPWEIETEVDMTNLKSGVYIIKVQVGEQVDSFRVIKE